MLHNIQSIDKSLITILQGRNSIMRDGRGYWALTSMQEAQAPKLDRFSNTTAAIANLCISVHYSKLNLTLPSASMSQKITFIFMKCTKTVAIRAMGGATGGLGGQCPPLLLQQTVFIQYCTSDWISTHLTLVDTCQVNDIWKDGLGRVSTVHPPLDCCISGVAKWGDIGASMANQIYLS